MRRIKQQSIPTTTRLLLLTRTAPCGYSLFLALGVILFEWCFIYEVDKLREGLAYMDHRPLHMQFLLSLGDSLDSLKDLFLLLSFDSLNSGQNRFLFHRYQLLVLVGVRPLGLVLDHQVPQSVYLSCLGFNTVWIRCLW